MIKMLTDHESKFGQPIMTVQKVSDAIVNQIVSQNSGQVVLPSSKKIARVVRAMPTWMQETVRSIEAGKLWHMRQAQRAEENALAK